MQWDLQCSGTILHAPGLKDSKYTRGVVAFVTGSERYPGAALLGVSAAVQTGAGYVRYVGPTRCEDAILAAHPEVVFGEGTANAWVVGSGMDSAIAESGRRSLILSLLPGSLQTADRGRDGQLPFVVMDAGALSAFYTAVKAAPDSPVIPRTVITPHSGEAAALARALDYDVQHGEIEASPRIWAQILADRLGCVCVLKGADTVIATANRPGDLLEFTQGTHWLATAGTGDVLAGVIGTLIAQNASRIDNNEVTLAQVAATGVALHGLAGSLAARDAMALGSMGLLPFIVTTNGGPINATDVISYLSLAYEIIANPNDGTFAKVRAIVDPTGELERKYRAAVETSAAPQGPVSAPAPAASASPSDGDGTSEVVPDFGEPSRPSVVLRAGSGSVVVPGSQVKGRMNAAANASTAAKGGSGRVAVPGAQAPKGGSGRVAVPGAQAPKGGSGRVAVPGAQAPKSESATLAKPRLKGGSGRVSVPGAQVVDVFSQTVTTTPGKGGSGRIAVPGAQVVAYTHQQWLVSGPASSAASQSALEYGEDERFVPGSYRSAAQTAEPAPQPAEPAPTPAAPLPQNVTTEPQPDGSVDVVVPIRSASDPGAGTVGVSRSRSRIYNPDGDILRPTAEPAMKKVGDDPVQADKANRK